MKWKISGFTSLFFLAFLLCFVSTSSARLLQINPAGEKVFKANQMILHADAEKDFSDLMGAEECYEKDEECVKRRMIQDAHLDYIYTQNHKP